MAGVTRRAFFRSAVAGAGGALGAAPYALAGDQDRLLDDLSHRAFLYFWEQADPQTGLVLDRAAVDGSQRTPRSLDVASMASTGFALAACCIAGQRGWVDPNAARERVRTTLRYLTSNQAHQFGWYYHFVNRKTGARVWNCELSTIDTALLVAGAVTAQQCFRNDAEIFQMARDLYERVDFDWMLDSHSGFLRMAWKPETGFLLPAWVDYRENVILHMLALGSPTHPIPAGTWFRFRRDPIIFQNYAWVGRGPIFTHQFPQAYLDFSNLRDGLPYGINYFHNSVIATYAHRSYCQSLRSLFPAYSNDLWGVTPSDSSIGYLTWGGWDDIRPRRDWDGTIAPCASAGSLMFAPEICLPALRAMHNDFGELAYGRYGFADAFNPASGWVDPEVLGIDLGITLLSAENLRSRQVWKWFMRSPDIQRAVSRVFQPNA